MLVRHFMSRDVVTLDEKLTCVEAWDRFRERGLRRAPVTRRDKVVAMVTDRDLLRVLPWTLGALEDPEAAGRSLSTRLAELRRRPLVSVSPDDHLETAARVMLDQRIGGVPVIEDDVLCGILTESDLFRVFVGTRGRAGCTRLTLHWAGAPAALPDPGRLALATGIELWEYTRHQSPVHGVLLGLRVRGPRVKEYQERLLSAGFLLLDREDFAEAEE